MLACSYSKPRIAGDDGENGHSDDMSVKISGRGQQLKKPNQPRTADIEDLTHQSVDMNMYDREIVHPNLGSTRNLETEERFESHGLDLTCHASQSFDRGTTHCFSSRFSALERIRHLIE